MADFTEEPWEADIGAMLGGLPQVEPPNGFFDAALDHRPLHAGRLLGGLMAASVVAVVLSVATGAVGRSRIAPAIDELADRHSVAVQAGVFGSGHSDVGYRIETPVAMPDGFERTRNIAVEDLRQAIYAKGDESVSVFVQGGRLNWSALPSDGLTEIDGRKAWVDPSKLVTIVEASEDVVTIVGLPAEDVGEVLAEVPRTGPSVGQRTRNLVEAITEQLGYPHLD